MAKLNQRKIKEDKNEAYKKKFQRFHSKEEKQEARRERIKAREKKWLEEYYGHKVSDDNNN